VSILLTVLYIIFFSNDKLFDQNTFRFKTAKVNSFERERGLDHLNLFRITGFRYYMYYMYTILQQKILVLHVMIIVRVCMYICTCTTVYTYMMYMYIYMTLHIYIYNIHDIHSIHDSHVCTCVLHVLV